jgi:hypothetical protein
MPQCRPSSNTGPPARAAIGGPRPNRPNGVGFGRRDVFGRRSQVLTRDVRAGSEALNVSRNRKAN